ncbi:hypothetical protein DLM45_13290 [Hyphomicrobium methylovorum]|uniref:hypothetical protein n=1 Tax=Hyphomicrobium methylovorum TaxID=84 RepID=UPI0015E7BFCF|nr:hypothetical protein [Hyphomicrobium methylovorum]MBA2127188.1 hypothetical protein [Hyphomicrobium methylovorum]
MKTVACMATYPARASTIEAAAASIARQVDQLNICFNEYDRFPAWLEKYPNIDAAIPVQNFIDVGKFCFDVDPQDEVVLVDDDILYPVNYVSELRRHRCVLGLSDVIVGVHGVIYADLFDGSASARRVFHFQSALNRYRVVNQLGTGTVLLKGFQMPSRPFLAGSERYVDLRFAVYAHRNRWPMVCVPREANWLNEQESGTSIFADFTERWPEAVVRESQEIAGYAKLDLSVVADVVSRSTAMQTDQA